MEIKLDLSEINGTGSNFDLLEPGDYDVTIVDTMLKQTKDGRKQFTVVLETDSGRRIYGHCPLHLDFGLIRFKRLLLACGHPTPDRINDTEELHGRRCRVRVKIKGEFNEVVKYMEASDGDLLNPMRNLPDFKIR